MKLTKFDVQKRVSHKGRSIDLDGFAWDENTNTFSSNLDDLVLDFNDVCECTFKTGSRCHFNTWHNCVFITKGECTFVTGWFCNFKTKCDCNFSTGSECTFKTGSRCNFSTGNKCTFDTGSKCDFSTGHDCTLETNSECTFNTGSKCVIIRRDVFQVIHPRENIVLQLHARGVEGYLEDRYLNGNKALGKHLMIDGILST